jgi:hypothetical protein
MTRPAGGERSGRPRYESARTAVCTTETMSEERTTDE